MRSKENRLFVGRFGCRHCSVLVRYDFESVLTRPALARKSALVLPPGEEGERDFLIKISKLFCPRRLPACPCYGVVPAKKKKEKQKREIYAVRRATTLVTAAVARCVTYRISYNFAF